MIGSYNNIICSCPVNLTLDNDDMNCVGRSSHTHTHDMIDVELMNIDEYLYSLGNDNSRSSAINGGAIAGGIIGAILAVVIYSGGCYYVCVLLKRRSRSNTYKTTKYSRPNPDFESTSSRQNLAITSTTIIRITVTTQYRGQQNHAYSHHYTLVVQLKPEQPSTLTTKANSSTATTCQKNCSSISSSQCSNQTNSPSSSSEPQLPPPT